MASVHRIASAVISNQSQEFKVQVSFLNSIGKKLYESIFNDGRTKQNRNMVWNISFENQQEEMLFSDIQRTQRGFKVRLQVLYEDNPEKPNMLTHYEDYFPYVEIIGAHSRSDIMVGGLVEPSHTKMGDLL